MSGRKIAIIVLLSQHNCHWFWCAD